MSSARPQVSPVGRAGTGFEAASRLLLACACLGFAAIAVVSWILVAAAHVGDSYGVDHVSGAWLGLAQRLGEGTLYPPLYDGESFGGTRFMPIPIVLHGALGYLIGDYLVVGRLIAYILMAALVVVVVLVLRRESCPFPVAALLAATLLVTGTGLTAGTWIRHDTLPVVLQLVAVAVVARSTSRNALLAAAALCALALTAKLSAIWAPLAIGLWLLVRERSRLAVRGRAARGVRGDHTRPANGQRRRARPLGVAWVRFVRPRADPTPPHTRRWTRVQSACSSPSRLLVVAVAIWRRRAILYHVSLVVSLPVLAFVLADRGAWSNHLLDLQVLSVVVLGSAWPALAPLLRTGIVVIVLATGIVAYEERVQPIEAARVLVDGDSSRLPEVARRLDPSMHLLSENPYVPISLGQRPVVLDAFMLRSVVNRDHEARDDLVRRLDEREFDAVVLFDRSEARSTSSDVRRLFHREDFGRETVDAVERNYRPASTVAGDWIYERRPKP